MTACAVGTGIASGVIGLAVSEQWNIAAGGAIVLTAAAIFAVSLVVTSATGRLTRARPERHHAEKAAPIRSEA
jgi:manganese/iron transport system permease protein